MNETTAITDVAGVATAAGVLFAAAQLALARTQAKTRFEDDVATQYRELIKPRIIDALLTRLDRDDRQLVEPFYAYFDLCNEQVFLRLQGRVRRRTWTEWAEGIESNLTREPIAGAWATVRRGLPEFAELKLLEASGYNADPRAWNPIWRRAVRRELGVGDRRFRHRHRRHPAGSTRGAVSGSALLLSLRAKNRRIAASARGGRP